MPNLFDLTGRVCLVTGGNGGIGLGMAHGLAAHGATVVIWGTNAEKNREAGHQLAEHGGTVRTAVVDISDETAVNSAMQSIIDEFGRIDQAIANAGILLHRKSMFDITESDFRKTFGVNVEGAFFTLREAARHMIDQNENDGQRGSLVAVSSTSSIHGAARMEHYGASKGALVSMVRAMAVELGPHGIRVNSVCPGWTRSDVTSSWQDSQKFNEKVMSRVPIGGWADPSDFSGVAVYLASPSSRFHTGDAIVIDGGYTVF